MTNSPGFEVGFYFFWGERERERELVCGRYMSSTSNNTSSEDNFLLFFYYYYIRIVLEIVRTDFTTKRVTNHKISNLKHLFSFI